MKTRRSLSALTWTESSPALPNTHRGASVTSTLFIAIAYPPVVKVSVGELK
jgi:hypothetical protein